MRAKSFTDDVLPLKDTLYRLALRIVGASEEAKDVVQETMARVWRQRDRLDGMDSVEAYCLTACRHIAIDATRRRAQMPQLPDNAPEPPDRAGADDPQKAAERRDSYRLVRSIIATLPEKQRTAIELRDFQGRSYKEVAEVMGITQDQVKVSIFRARQAIRQKFTSTQNYGL